MLQTERKKAAGGFILSAPNASTDIALARYRGWWSNMSETNEIWLIVFQGIPQLAFTTRKACESWLKFQAGKTLHDLDKEDHEGDYEYYEIELEHGSLKGMENLKSSSWRKKNGKQEQG